jgi:hypothetical protein
LFITGAGASGQLFSTDLFREKRKKFMKNRITIGIVTLAIAMCAGCGHKDSDTEATDLQNQVTDLKKQVAEARKLAALKRQVAELQQQLNETEKTTVMPRRRNKPWTAPTSIIQMIVEGGATGKSSTNEVRIRLGGPSASAEIEPSVKTARPLVEIQDDIKDFQRRIRYKETDLALERANARRQNSNPMGNIVRRANIDRMEADLADMRSELMSLVAELHQKVPRP